MITIFLKKLLLLVLAAILCLAAIFFSPIAFAHPLASIINKKEILRDSNKFHRPRMIFVGGSAALVGIDGTLIEKNLPYYPVNMGINAGFSTHFLLDLIKSEIKAGDVIVLTPETGALASYSYKSDDQNRKWCFAVNRDYALKNLYKLPAQFSDLTLDLLGLCQWKVLGLVQAALLRKVPFKKGYLQFDQQINGYGDARENFFKPISIDMIRKIDVLWPLSNRIDTSFITDFNDFASFVTSKGATLYFVFSPFSKEGYSKNFKKIQEIISLLKNSAKFPIIGTQDGFIYDYSCFTNSPYHLNADCRSKRTVKMMSEIKPYLLNAQTAEGRPVN
jgi:hypothetical protein